MTFLNSVFLFLLSAVSIPLIIHFLSKRRIKTIEFSSLKFLEQMQKSRMRWLKIKEMLLLIMRMLIIALIVMAFARPTLRGFIGSSRASSSVVIILDRSASMDSEGETGNLFDEAKRSIARLIDSFDPNDRVTLIAFPGDGPLESIGPTGPGEKLKERLGAIDLGYQKGNTGQALKTALAALGRSTDLNREIYIFSDMQSINFKDLPPEILNQNLWKNIHLFIVSPKPTQGDNIGITDVVMPSQLLVPGEQFDLETELTNYGKGRLENILVGVTVDGERKAQNSVALAPGQPSRFPFSIKVDTPGDHGGFIEIDHDRYELDNRRYFSFHIPEKIKLLTVSQAPGGNQLLKLALDRPEAGQIAYNEVGANDLLREDLAQYNVILLNDIASLDPSKKAAISRFLSGGGGIFVALGKNADTNYWKRFLDSVAGVTPGDMRGKPGEFISWDNFDYEHPIFSIYTSDLKDKTRPSIPSLKMTLYRNLSGGDVLGSSATGVNLLAESGNKAGQSSAANGSVIVFGSGLDLLSSDLPAHSFFIPFIVRSVEYLGSRNTSGGSGGIIGQTVQWNLSDNAAGGLALVSPAGDAEDLHPVQSGAGSVAKITEYGQPGLYSLKQENKTLGMLSFNIDNSESENDFISAQELGERIGVAPREIDPNSDMKTSVIQARFGRELWKEFLFLALLLLIAESILGRTSPPKVVEAK